MDLFNNILLNTELSDATKEQYIQRRNTILEFTKKSNITEIFFEGPAKFSPEFDKFSSDNDLSIQTKATYSRLFISIIKYNRIMLQEHFKELVAEWMEWVKIHNSKLKEIYDSNEPTQKQKDAYVEYEEIERMRDALPFSQEKLLLIMYTKFPPVRCDYAMTKIFIVEEKVDDTPIEYDDNYIVYNRDVKRGLIFLKKYKTVDKYGVLYFHFDAELMLEIFQCITKLHNDELYLFTNSRGQKYNTKNAFDQWANKTLKKLFNKPGMCINMLRHIYISREDLDLTSKTGLERQLIATKMGHSVETQQKYLWLKK